MVRFRKVAIASFAHQAAFHQRSQGISNDLGATEAEPLSLHRVKKPSSTQPPYFGIGLIQKLPLNQPSDRHVSSWIQACSSPCLMATAFDHFWPIRIYSLGEYAQLHCFGRQTNPLCLLLHRYTSAHCCWLSLCEHLLPGIFFLKTPFWVILSSVGNDG